MPSVGNAVSAAFERTKWILFRPFNLNKWLVLGFCAFLAGLGEGGGGGNFGGQGGGRGGGGGLQTREAVQFVEEHLLVIVLGGVAVLLLVAGVTALVQWLSSRGKFMLLHGVATNTAAVVDPWKRYREPANSLFAFRFALFAIGVAVVLGTGVLAAVLAWPDLYANRFGGGAIAGIALLVGVVATMGFAMIVLKNVLEDFVVPVMYLRNVRTVEGLGIFRRELLSGHLGTFVLFYLLKIVLGLGAGLLVLAGMCLTCCLAALPYVSSVVFLPIAVFFRSYSLSLLEQFGPEWYVFRAYDEPPSNGRYHYDEEPSSEDNPASPPPR